MDQKLQSFCHFVYFEALKNVQGSLLALFETLDQQNESRSPALSVHRPRLITNKMWLHIPYIYV